jgi:hypothetical protein
MTKFKNSITIILLFSFFLISTCTNDNSVTGSYDQSLGKTTGVADKNGIASGNKDKHSGITEAMSNCLFSLWLMPELDMVFISVLDLWFPTNPPDYSNNISIPNDFKDKFLSKSKKGIEYTEHYYKLSKYGIENNLVNQYYKEHVKLLYNSIGAAYELQYGSKADQILISKVAYDDLKDMLKVYRNSMNHKEIEPVLDYLEMDLDKYYNKPKYAIAADFEEN